MKRFVIAFLSCVAVAPVVRAQEAGHVWFAFVQQQTSPSGEMRQ